MSDKIFIDTNLLIYSISTDSAKAATVEQMLRKPLNFIVSTQIINEFVHTCYRKNLLSASDVKRVVEEFLLFFELVVIEENTIRSALDLKLRYGYSWYDSLVIAAALENECSTLLSEDLQHGQIIDGRLTILNPFIT
jgi:predicted nucleic acid-binding protein